MTLVDDDDDDEGDGPDIEFDLASVALPNLTVWLPALGDSIDVGPDTSLLPDTTREYVLFCLFIVLITMFLFPEVWLVKLLIVCCLSPPGHATFITFDCKESPDPPSTLVSGLDLL